MDFPAEKWQSCRLSNGRRPIPRPPTLPPLVSPVAVWGCKQQGNSNVEQQLCPTYSII